MNRRENAEYAEMKTRNSRKEENLFRAFRVFPSASSAFSLPLLAIVLVFAGQVAAQERSKPEDFGSSLKRLKWDDRKKQAVERDQKKRDQKQKDDATEAAPARDDVVRIETHLAVVEALVLDPKGRYVRGLGSEDFIITEDGRPQQAATFALGDGTILPRSIVLIIDYSGSQFPFLNNSLDAARILVDRLRPTDRMAIVTDDIELLTSFTSNKDELKRGLETIRRRAASDRLGRSRQYSALFAVLRELIEEEERPIIIFQTDGDELDWLRSTVGDPGPRGAEYGMGDILAALERSRATVYSVIPGVRLMGLSADERKERLREFGNGSRSGRTAFAPQMDGMPDGFYLRLGEMRARQQTALAALSKLTGGWAEFLEQPEQAVSIYSRIFSGIHLSYVIGLYPLDEARDDRRRKIEIKIRNHPEYIVWGRKSYIVPAP
jgi:VWFA-related protein